MMQMKVVRQTLIMLLLSNATYSYAEPSSSVRYLMNEPVSRFYMGLYQLNAALEDQDFKLPDERGKLLVNVGYSGDENRIKISLIDYKFLATNSSQAKSWCKSKIWEVKRRLFVNPEKGIPYGERSSLENYFARTSNYFGDPDPEGLVSELERITMIEVAIGLKNNERHISCSSQLLDKDVLYSE